LLDVLDLGCILPFNPYKDTGQEDQLSDISFLTIDFLGVFVPCLFATFFFLTQGFKIEK
jgi:hypothetical protein